MPSLRDLEEFKASFYRLGNEQQSLMELNLTPDDLPLPLHEPAADFSQPSAQNPMDPFPGETEEFLPGSFETEGDDSGTDLNFGDLGDLLGGMDSSFLDTPADGQEDQTPLSDFSDEGEVFEEPSGGEDTDFGNLLNSIPDDFTEDPDQTSDWDAGSPPGLLDGFADEIEAERTSAGELPPEDSGEGDFGDELEDLDLGDQDFADLEPSGEDLPDQGSSGGAVFERGLGNIDLDSLPSFESDETLELHKEDAAVPTEEFKEDAGEADIGESLEDLDFEDLGLPDESQSMGDQEIDGEGLEDFPDFDSDETMELSGEEPLADFEAPGELESLEEAAIGDDFEFEEASGEVPATTSEDSEAMELSDDDDNFDMGGESSDFDTGAVLEEISGDSFDNFKLDSNALAGNFDLDSGSAEGFGDELDSLDDFSLAGVDSVFAGKSPSAGAAPRAGAGRAGKAAGKPADEVKEIRLTNEELEQFQTTLSSYPLNLRIACEELIAEQAVAPDLMSRLVDLLVRGASAGETAALAGQILGRTIPIPKGFEKKTGEALEAEQASFAYIFIHNFLPVFRLFLMIALVILSAGYLGWRFIYTPLRAERIYKLGYERIGAGEYGRANERFLEAFRIHEKKPWFYKYARAFREARQYTLAEEKYRELLYYTASKNKRHIPEKQAVLEYADMETNAIGNYQSADEILRHNILDYNPFDQDALLALGDNSLAWGEYEAPRLEDARDYYARYMERYGRSDPLLERMLKYFIRTDDLEEVLALQSYFMGSNKRNISASGLAEMGGYLLDKRYEKVRGVPNEYLDRIGGIREMLLRAVQQDSMLPESYYQLARYYNYFENSNDERLTLDLAVRVFEAAKEESPRRIRYHILTLRQYGEALIRSKEFFPAEENLVKGINLYQDGLSRRLLTRSPEFGRLYADLGDLEYFVKDGDMQSALDYYLLGEQSGWAPPEIQYRMGAAYYQLRQWGPAQDRLIAAYREMAPNRRILYALGNVSYMRGNYFAAQGYYDRLLEILEADRSRLPPITPTDDEKQLDLAERLMVAQNNLGVTLEGLTDRTGNNRYRSRAQGLYADSERAWDMLTRNPTTMMRMRPSPDITGPGVNPAYLNVQNSLRPVPGYEPQFFMRIDKDMLEPSAWEDLSPPGYRLSQGVDTGR